MHAARRAPFDRSQARKAIERVGSAAFNGRGHQCKALAIDDAEAFSGFLGLLKNAAQKPLTVILDNPSIHKAKSLEPIVKYLKTQGVTLYFLPPYSPELNRTERFWHAMKFTWMAPKYRDSKMLEADADEILDNFGTKYKFAF